MTTTKEVVEIIDAVIVEDALAPAEAKAVDAQIRKLVSSIETDMEALNALLAEAKTGSIHVALGFKSWTAYVADAVTIRPKDSTERKELVNLLSGEGLSSRAIGEVVGVTKTTVNRDLKDGGTNVPPAADKKVTGLDGVEQPATKPTATKPKATSKPKADTKVEPVKDEGPKLPKPLKEKLDPAICSADDTLNDLEALAKNLDRLWNSAAWANQPTADKELTGMLTAIRKAVSALPKRPVAKGARK